MTPEEVCGAYDNATDCNGNSKCTFERNGTCDPKVDCTSLDETECAGESTCAIEEESACQPSGMCGSHTTESACNAANGCKYFAGYGCLDKCLEFDGDPTACGGAPGCEYDSTLGYCNSSCSAITSAGTCGTTVGCTYGVVSRECTQVYDCTPNDNNEAACNGDTNCEYTDTSECAPTDVAVGECIDKYAVGEEDLSCTILSSVGTGQSEICASGACYIDESGIGRCSEKTNYGCVADDRLKEIVGMAFLFGLVRMRRRRKTE
jgi:hypothetical protein